MVACEALVRGSAERRTARMPVGANQNFLNRKLFPSRRLQPTRVFGCVRRPEHKKARSATIGNEELDEPEHDASSSNLAMNSSMVRSAADVLSMAM